MNTLTLQPPGSFPLCVDEACWPAAVDDLQYVTSSLVDAVKEFDVVGLILTGSVARGEGAVTVDSNRGITWLSDLEFHVLVPGSQRQIPTNLDRCLLKLEEQLSSSKQNGLRVGFKTISTGQFERIRPAIFAVEMLRHGKLVWGDPSRVALPKWWTNGQFAIPRLDAFRLLNNRLVQLVQSRCQSERGTDLTSSYTLQKFWIELATSLSVFLGCYRSSYAERVTAMADCLTGDRDTLGATGRAIVSKLSEAIEVKFGRTIPPACTADAFDQAGEAARVVWSWETADKTNASSLGSLDDIFSRLKRMEPPAQRMRDWVRLLRRRTDRHFGQDLRLALRFGSLATAIYGITCTLAFSWNSIIAAEAPFLRRRQHFVTMLRCTSERPFLQRQEIAEAIIGAWDRHLRFSPR